MLITQISINFQEQIHVPRSLYPEKALATSQWGAEKAPSHILEKAMAPHSSTLAWKVPWMEEPGGLQSMGLLRVGHD